MSIEQELAAAIEHHRCGRLAEAEALYQQVLARFPQHANALRLLGVVAMQEGRTSLAIELIGRALDISPTSAECWVNLANARKAGGDSEGAVDAYRQALRLRADYPQAHYNLGIALGEQGQFQESIEAYREALRLKPDYREACINLGSVLENAGRIDEAIAAYRQAIDLEPDRADAYNNLANALRKSGRLDEAVAACERALCLDANLVEAQNNLGVARFEQGRIAAAIECYQHAIQLKPDYTDACINLAMAFNAIGQPLAAVEAFQRAVGLAPRHADACRNLGLALMEKGRLEDAIGVYHRALAIGPACPQTYNDLGNALRNVGRLDDAVAAYRAAIELKPDAAAHFYNLGNVLLDQRRLEEALAAYRESSRLQPDSAKILTAVGSALGAMNRTDEAIDSYLQALQLNETLVDAHLGLSLASLVRGDFERGWREYEWRWKLSDLAAARTEFTQPQWEGEALGGRSILLHAEQGFGDTIQFIRYAPLVASRGGRVMLVCPPELCRLMREVQGMSEVVAAGSALPAFDFHCPLLSLPRVFGTRLESIPAKVPYIMAPRALAGAWAGKWGRPDARLRVAIAWDGRSKSTRQRRAIGLSQLAVLAKAGGVVFYSVQKGEAAAQAADVPQGMELIDLAPQLRDFADTAAVLSQMDLVISIDTSVAHLAGALGKPAWIFLPHNPDWRWLLNRDDSPWYPTVRLFRQETPGDWDSVIGRMAAVLGKVVEERRR